MALLFAAQLFLSQRCFVCGISQQVLVSDRALPRWRITSNGFGMSGVESWVPVVSEWKVIGWAQWGGVRDSVGGLRKFESRLGVGDCGGGLVVEAGLGRHATVAGNVTIVARCTVHGIGVIHAWVAHELALSAVANACGVVWVVAVAAVVIDSSLSALPLSFRTVLHSVLFVGVVVVDIMNLRLL
jgi:hypothetical protein